MRRALPLAADTFINPRVSKSACYALPQIDLGKQVRDVFPGVGDERCVSHLLGFVVVFVIFAVVQVAYKVVAAAVAPSPFVVWLITNVNALAYSLLTTHGPGVAASHRALIAARRAAVIGSLFAILNIILSAQNTCQLFGHRHALIK